MIRRQLIFFFKVLKWPNIWLQFLEQKKTSKRENFNEFFFWNRRNVRFVVESIVRFILKSAPVDTANGEKKLVEMFHLDKTQDVFSTFRCSRVHNKPTFSQTILLKNLYFNPNNQKTKSDGNFSQGNEFSANEIQQHFE